MADEPIKEQGKKKPVEAPSVTQTMRDPNTGELKTTLAPEEKSK